MVGDDIETDVLAAQRQGLIGVLVKTGKYLPRTYQAATGTPTMSWTPSPACPPCWSNCRERPARRIWTRRRYRPYDPGAGKEHQHAIHRLLLRFGPG